MLYNYLEILPNNLYHFLLNVNGRFLEFFCFVSINGVHCVSKNLVLEIGEYSMPFSVFFLPIQMIQAKTIKIFREFVKVIKRTLPPTIELSKFQFASDFRSGWT